MALSSTQPVVSTNVHDNLNMMYKNYQDQDVPNVLSRFAPVREPGFYLDASLLRGIYVTPIVFSVVFYRWFD